MKILIETYWNVNQIEKAIEVMQYEILIETYWNVNFNQLIRCKELPLY